MYLTQITTVYRFISDEYEAILITADSEIKVDAIEFLKSVTHKKVTHNLWAIKETEKFIYSLYSNILLCSLYHYYFLDQFLV